MTGTVVASDRAVTPRTSAGAGDARVGHLVGIAVNVAMLAAVNVRPGWQAVPFLTDGTPRVLGLVNLALAVAVAANVVNLVHDAPWLRALGGLVTTSVGLAAVVRVLQVFPVTEGGTTPVIARAVLVVGVAGSVIAVVVQVVTLVRALLRPGGGRLT